MLWFKDSRYSLSYHCGYGALSADTTVCRRHVSTSLYIQSYLHSVHHSHNGMKTSIYYPPTVDIYNNSQNVISISRLLRIRLAVAMKRLCRQLHHSFRRLVGQYKRYKDCLKTAMTQCGIIPSELETLAMDRTG